jgi:hypothetical protein
MTLADSVKDEVHALNNALTTIVGLADWHLGPGSGPGSGTSLRDDLTRILAAAADAEASARRLRELVRVHRRAEANTDGLRRRAAPPAATGLPRA